MDALQERARQRASRAPAGIGASFDRTVSPPDLDGFRFRLWVSDGTQVAALEAQVSKTEQVLASEIPTTTLERVVERLAGRFPAERRLDTMARHGRIRLRSDDFSAEDFRAE